MVEARRTSPLNNCPDPLAKALKSKGCAVIPILRQYHQVAAHSLLLPRQITDDLPPQDMRWHMVRATRDAARLNGSTAADVWHQAHEIRGGWTKKERFCRALEAQRLQQMLWQSVWHCNSPQRESSQHEPTRRLPAKPKHAVA